MNIGERNDIMETNTYSRVARWLHWIMALLIVGNLIGGFVHDANPQLIMPLHKSTGLLVLALAFFRLGWRFAHPVPPYPATMAAWEKLAASVTHFLLYAFMILIPLSGWIMSSAGDRPLDFYGLFAIPKFAVTREDAIVSASGAGHELLAFAMIALLLLHVAAALRHHFVLKDGVLRRMLG